MELESIRGVGPKTAAALAELPDATAAIERGDVYRLAQAPGVSEARAVQIVEGALRDRYGDDSELLGTAMAASIHDELVEVLTDRAETRYGRARLRTLYPTASMERIETVRARVESALELRPTAAVIEAFDGLAPFERGHGPRIRDRCLVAGDDALIETATARYPELSVEVADDATTIADLARGYAEVIVIDETYVGYDLPENVEVDPAALETPTVAVPERELLQLVANRPQIEAARRVYAARGIDPPVDLDALEAAVASIDAEGQVRLTPEMAQQQAIADDLQVAAEAGARAGNERLRAAIAEREVRIEGTDLLSLAEAGATIEELLDRELEAEYAAALEVAMATVTETLGLEDAGELPVAALFPREPTFPIEPVDARVTAEVSARRDEVAMARVARRRTVAGTVAELRPAVETMIETALEWDVDLAIARFADDLDCTMPHFDAGGPAVVIEGGRSPVMGIPQEAIEPVSYQVDSLSLLSGVNSGGKTSILELIASVVILAHMGLPVPADRVQLRPITGLQYHGKTQGTLDAGAFEATLQRFSTLLDGRSGQLVLVDELESITEPGAAAKIVAGIVDGLADQGTTGVFVSHMAAAITDAARSELTIDGIEAVGLIDGELEVNRSPVRDLHARSTPELIVEKLAEEEGHPLFFELLEKFQPGND
jgi:dsDNA-specific endonuclease/ATPase MutS2